MYKKIKKRNERKALDSALSTASNDNGIGTDIPIEARELVQTKEKNILSPSKLPRRDGGTSTDGRLCWDYLVPTAFKPWTQR
jgi:hypothetical protein